jgi:hypothetical protein
MDANKKADCNAIGFFKYVRK